MWCSRFPVVGYGRGSRLLVTQIVANVIMMWVVKDLRKGFKTMVQGVMFRGLR